VFRNEAVLSSLQIPQVCDSVDTITVSLDILHHHYGSAQFSGTAAIRAGPIK
jgi:hypothetical protein